MSKGAGFESWNEGIGLYPFQALRNEHIEPTEGRLHKLQTGMKRAYVDSKMSSCNSLANFLYSNDDHVFNANYLSDGGRLFVSDLSYLGEQGIEASFDPQGGRGQRVVAYFEKSDESVSCSVQIGDLGSKSYREFRTNDPEFLQQSFKVIRQEMATVEHVLHRAAVEVGRR